MTPLETRLLDMLRRHGPMTDKRACQASTWWDGSDRRKALEHLLALGMVTFTRRRGERKYKWRIAHVHAVPEPFVNALRTACALKRQLMNHLDQINLNVRTLEDAETTANTLALLTGSPAERRHALRVLHEARALCAAILDAHRRLQ